MQRQSLPLVFHQQPPSTKLLLAQLPILCPDRAKEDQALTKAIMDNGTSQNNVAAEEMGKAKSKASASSLWKRSQHLVELVLFFVPSPKQSPEIQLRQATILSLRVPRLLDRPLPRLLLGKL